MDFKDLQSVEAEAGVISTLLFNPQFIFQTEQLQSEHFYDQANGALFSAIKKLALDGVDKIDAFNLGKTINENPAIRHFVVDRGVDINELFELGVYACRENPLEYKALVKEIQDKSLRRDLYNQLQRASTECINNKTDDIQNRVYGLIEDVNKKYAHTKELQLFADKIDGLWKEVYDRQNGKILTIPFHIDELNEYVQLEAGELVLIGGSQKSGKSAFLLSSTVSLLKKGMSVLVIDSELSDRLYMLRLLAHVSQVPFRIVKDGIGTEDEKRRIEEAKEWLKTTKLIHEYVPLFEDTEIMTLFKRVNAINKVDVLVVDYFKISNLGDAYTVSTTMANTVNVVKNSIAGVYNIPVLGAVQTDKAGNVALSAGIVRHCSTLVYIKRKTSAEIQNDGIDCGNTKAIVTVNRNGRQHSDESEYIDINFLGDILTYEGSKKQHEVAEPY